MELDNRMYTFTGIGNVAGIVYALNNNAGFWMGLFYFLLFGLIGSIIGSLFFPPKETEKTTI